jgi:hypothetical protein
VEHVSELLRAIESEVRASPRSCFELGADGAATLRSRRGQWHAGRFAVPTLGELRARVVAKASSSAKPARLLVLLGSAPSTDIGALQASAPSGVLFQAASQFNCLEAPGPSIVPVAAYTGDPTQGPRAAVSAFPGTFLRHYFAPRPSGERFVQHDHDGLELLADALPAQLGRARSGYLTTEDLVDPRAAAHALDKGFDKLRVGVHDDVEVVFGAGWGGAVERARHPRIAQVYTSTIALGGYSRRATSSSTDLVVRQLQRAAYLGTLLAAIDLGKHTVVLTMIGGGVFGNPHHAIWDAIFWALEQVAPFAGGLDVIVNSRLTSLEDAHRERALSAGGEVLAT